MAAEIGQRVQLRPGFHPFAHDLQIERAGHGNDRGHDRPVARIDRDIAHQRTVELQRIERQRLHVAEIGKAGAEIIERHAHAVRRERLKRCGTGLEIADQRLFGDFQGQPIRGKAGMRQNAAQTASDIACGKILGGDVERQAQRRGPLRRQRQGARGNMLRQLRHQIAPVGHGEQRFGRNPAKAGMIPASQRLGPGQRPAAAIELRLEQHGDLVAVHRAKQIGLEQRGAGAGHRLGLIGPQHAPPGHAFQGVAGARQPVDHHVAMIVGANLDQRDTRHQVQRIALYRQCAADDAGQRLGPILPVHPVATAGHRQNELPARQPRQKGLRIKRGAGRRGKIADPFGHIDQHLVSGRFAIGKIDRLQPRQADQHGARATGQRRGIDPVARGGRIGQPCQIIARPILRLCHATHDPCIGHIGQEIINRVAISVAPQWGGP